MLRAADRRTILVIEGDSDESALYGHVDEAAVNMIPGYGKGIVEPAMAIVNKTKTRDIIAMLDRDLRGLVGVASDSPDNVFYTDYYDLDATVLLSGGLGERLACNFSNVATVKAVAKSLNVASIVQAAIVLALPLGVLRLISVRDGLNLPLQKFPLGAVINDDCTRVDLEAMTRLAINRSSGQITRTPNELAAEVLDEVSRINQGDMYCCGHDLVKALAIILQKKAGVSIGHDMLENALRAAFSCNHIKRTKVYMEVGGWAVRSGKMIWACEAGH